MQIDSSNAVAWKKSFEEMEKWMVWDHLSRLLPLSLFPGIQEGQFL